VYVVDNWHKVPILLNLENIVDGGMFNNLTIVIIHFLAIFGGMSKIDIANKVVCFGDDGVIVFQGLKISVIVQLISKHPTFLL
jgi:hypothetical protein